MGTISNSLSGTNSLTSSNTTPNYFTGLSSYSQDLQQVISRSVAIASLPINLLSVQQNTLKNQSAELTTLDTNFTAVQSAIQNIQKALGGSGMNSTVSNPAVASVTLGDGAVEGAYTIHVSSIGSYAASLSTSAWTGATDSSGQPTAYNLIVGGHTYSFTPADNSAGTVAATINAQYGNLVQATAVNVGSAASPDYRLSLQSATLGPQTLDVQAQAGANLQTAQAAATGYATSLSAATWDASASGAPYTLVVDGVSYALSPTDNSAVGVAAAINAISGSPVQATVVNLGATDAPDERIQLQATSAANSTVDLQDTNGDSLQQQQGPVAAGAAISQTISSWDPTPDPSGNPATYTLTMGTNTQTFSASDDSAMSVAAAINSLAGAPVTANVIDLGTASAPDYRLQLIDNTGGGTGLQLSRSTAFALQAQGQPPGSLAEYEVANSGRTVTSTSREVSIASGTTVSLNGTGAADITVTQSLSNLSTALSGFADAYNAAVTELSKQYGQSGGPLTGQSIVYNLSHALSSMSTYYSAATGSIGMADLGFTLNQNGTLTYSPLTLMGTDLGNSSGVAAFLGSASSSGFLKTAGDAMNNLLTASTGLLKNTEASFQSQITSVANKINTKQAAVDKLQTNLIAQMARADAAIESMQQQYSYLNTMFAAQRTSNQLYAAY